MTNLRQSIKPFVPKTLRQFIRKLQARGAERNSQAADDTPINFNDIHVRAAAKLVNADRASVLVVGANTGGDCQRFVELGFPDVHGLDVIDEVGAEYADPRVTYHKMSIEDCSLPSGRFDLVYSLATMEHVPNIAAGFKEMARLVKPQGALYSVASPLWNSPYGHHMGCFNDHPWIHLAFDRDELIEYATKAGITGERGLSLGHVVNYMLNPLYFNRRSRAEYAAATENLVGLKIASNQFYLEDNAKLSHPLARRAFAKGYSEDELLAVTHELIAHR